MRDVIGAPAGWLARAIAAKKLSSVEVVRAHLEHIHTVNPRLNAVVFATAESAIKEARAADRRAKNRKAVLGPLHGVPFTVKDIFNTAGLPTTAGLRMLRSRIPDHDATVVARMRRAGAILIGKTNCPPSDSDEDGWTPGRGAARNPYDVNRSPGVTSSGEAAIIAAGGSPLGLGSDSGGSIRLPAAYCGVAALKPTAGLIPVTGAYGLVGGVTDTRGQVGPMARYVSDLRIAMKILAGPDGVDSGVVPVRAWTAPKLEGLRVAWYADDGLARPTSTVSATVKAAARALAAAGCTVTEERPPSLGEAYQVTLAFWGRKHMSYERLYERWDAFRTSVLKFMSRFDLVLSPVAPDIAPLLRIKPVGDHQLSYTVPYSLSGNPCVVVRAGTSAENLPIGVQVVAQNWRDATALKAARAIERALGGWRPASVVG
jgi:amidase